jgi:hypothetical protein
MCCSKFSSLVVVGVRTHNTHIHTDTHTHTHTLTHTHTRAHTHTHRFVCDKFHYGSDVDPKHSCGKNFDIKSHPSMCDIKSSLVESTNHEYNMRKPTFSYLTLRHFVSHMRIAMELRNRRVLKALLAKNPHPVLERDRVSQTRAGLDVILAAAGVV